MKRPRDYSDMHEPWEDEPIVDETYFGSPELPIMRPIIIHLLIIAFVIAILGWYFWPVKARADASIGIIDVAADLPVVHVLAVTGIVVLLALGTIQIVDAAMFGMSAVARVIVAAVMFVAAAITSAFSHEAPTGWSYPLSCCWSPSNAPAGRPGDCAEIASSTVVEAPDGYRITLNRGDHPVVNSTVTVTIPYGQEKMSPDGAYHLCLSDAMTPRCFFAGARGS